MTRPACALRADRTPVPAGVTDRSERRPGPAALSSALALRALRADPASVQSDPANLPTRVRPRRVPPAAALLALAAALWLAPAARAHDGVVHADPQQAAAHAARAPAAPALPFPVNIRAAFDLIDQTGAPRRAQDFLGAPMLVFFGYAGCDAICDVALPRMAAALDLLGPDAAALTPVMITVDPDNDTPQALAVAAPKVHPRLTALTGAPERLAAARAAFGVTVEKVAETPDGAPIYAHGSFVYLIGADGALLTVLPPILSPERMADVVRGYL